MSDARLRPWTHHRCAAAGALLVVAAPVAAITSFSDPNELRPINSFNPMVKLQIQRPEGTALCSGSLIGGLNHVVTAAHCLADSTGNPAATSIQMTFGNGATTMTSTSYRYPGEWNGDWATSGADIAIVPLSGGPPSGADSLVLPGGGTINTPLTVRVGGYGAWGKGGVDAGYNSATDPHLARIGANHYDDAPGKTPPLIAANYHFMDFDDYTGTNNFIGEPGWITVGNRRLIPQIDYPQDGTGEEAEALAAPGDSGGPSFVDNVLLGVHSWRVGPSSTGELAFDALEPLLILGDPPGFDAGYGNVVGDVIVANYVDWIRDTIAAGEYFDVSGSNSGGGGSGRVPVAPVVGLLAAGLFGWRLARRRPAQPVKACFDAR